MSVRLATCIISACLMLATHSARAEWAATGQLSELKLTVMDLAPDDGAAAAFYYHSAWTTTNSWLYVNGSKQYFTKQSNYFPVPPDLNVTAARDGGRIELEFLPGLFSTRTAAVGNSGAMDIIGEQAQVTMQSSLQLALAPHTALQVSTIYTGSLDRTGLESGLFFASSGANLTAEVSGNYFSDTGWLEARGDDADQFLSRELMLLLRNDGDTLLDLEITVGQAVGVAISSPVPEPSGYAMLLAGAIVLLPGLRRRREAVASRASDR